MIKEKNIQMKFIIFSFLLNLSLAVNGQLNIFNRNDTREAVINTQDSLTHVSLLISDEKKNNIDPEKTYTWYANHNIHSNAGTYTGNLLHGNYEVFDMDGNLIKQGIFHYGTRDGEWKYFNSKGMLLKVELWDKGIIKLQSLYNSRGEIIKIRNFDKKENSEDNPKEKSSTEKTEKKRNWLNRFFNSEKENKKEKKDSSIDQKVRKKKRQANKNNTLKTKEKKEETFFQKLNVKLKSLKTNNNSGKKEEK